VHCTSPCFQAGRPLQLRIPQQENHETVNHDPLEVHPPPSRVVKVKLVKADGGRGQACVHPSMNDVSTFSSKPRLAHVRPPVGSWPTIKE